MRKQSRFAVGAVVMVAMGFGLSGCKKSQHDRFEKMCAAEKYVVEDFFEGDPAKFTAIKPEDRLTVLAAAAGEYAGEEGDAYEVMKALANINPADKGSVLRTAAKEHGVASCALADRIDEAVRAGK